MCGARGVERCSVSVTLRSGVTVRGSEAEACPACGETYFDPAAMEHLEAARRTWKAEPHRSGRRGTRT